MVGAQDELVFDGRSFILNADGKNKLLAKMFKQEILDFNFSQSSNNEDLQVSSNFLEEVFKALRNGVRDYFSNWLYQPVNYLCFSSNCNH